MERASWNIKNGTSMAGSFVGQRGPREQMRIGGCEEEDREERRRTEKGAVQEYLLASLPRFFPPSLFSMRQTRSSFDSFPQGKLGGCTMQYMQHQDRFQRC